MKNVFLIGNGFDLHHKLPTKYFDFMCVANYLKNNTLLSSITIADILSNPKVYGKSRSIDNCYDTYKEHFENITIDFSKLTKISELVTDNIWFDYFMRTLNTEQGWVDFEKEISFVLERLNSLIPNGNSVLIPKDSEVDAFVLSNFRFFVDIDSNEKIYDNMCLDIKDEYLKEYPINSSIFIANKDAIVKFLHENLMNLRLALSLYLECFVESTLDCLKSCDYAPFNKVQLLELGDDFITFNYTNTLEKLYCKNKPHHIHGSIDSSNIVLGINPNESDNVGTENTTFIKFKKYYQREIFKTDSEYIDWYRKYIKSETYYRIIVIGHSLDITDSDILKTLFTKAQEIYISYYQDEDRDSYMSNIVKMFGSEGFSNFKNDKKMVFIPLSDLNSIQKDIEPEEIKWKRTTSYPSFDEVGEKIEIV